MPVVFLLTCNACWSAAVWVGLNDVGSPGWSLNTWVSFTPVLSYTMGKARSLLSFGLSFDPGLVVGSGISPWQGSAVVNFASSQWWAAALKFSISMRFKPLSAGWMQHLSMKGITLKTLLCFWLTFISFAKYFTYHTASINWYRNSYLAGNTDFSN